MDITLSGFALLVLAPLLVPVALALLLTGEHYVFYYQERIGRYNRRFKIWKFATMLKNSPNMQGGLHTTRRDPRVLPMGRFLRMTKINELPQLINILKGDMSVVGPRPLVDKTFDPYPDDVKQAIYNVRPGLTGIGSIVFRDEERLLSECGMPTDVFYARHIAPAKGALELWYQRRMSLWVDVALIFLTAWVIVFPKSGLLNKVFRDLPAVDVPGLLRPRSGRNGECKNGGGAGEGARLECDRELARGEPVDVPGGPRSGRNGECKNGRGAGGGARG